MDAEEIGRLIGELENRVERLRSLYEQYFMGIERIEPLTARKDVDRRLWALRREQIRNTGLRFKLETTIQRYNTYQQYWQRIVREIEAGTYQRDLGRAAQRFGDNAVTGFAKRRQKMFEKALSKKAERDALRQPGTGASQAPPAEAGDEAPPSSNETFDVTFDDTEAAEPPLARSPHVPSAQPHEPLELEISEPAPPLPRGAPARSAGIAPPAEPRRVLPPAEPRRVPPPAPAIAAHAPAAGPPRPAPPGAPPPYARPAAVPVANPAVPRATTAVPPPPPPRAPLPSSHGVPPAPPPANRNVTAAGVRPTPPTAMAAKLAAPPVTSAKPAALAVPGAKPATPIATPAKPGPPVAPSAKPATPIATPAAAAGSVTSPGRPQTPARPPSPATSGQPAAAPAPKPAASAFERPAAIRQPPTAPAVVAKPVAPAVQKPQAPAVRPPAVSRPDAPAPAVQSEENSLSPIRMRQIYGAFVEAKRRANESTASVTYEKIASNLENVAKELRAKHKARSVDFEVVLKNGKPVLKPVVKS